MKEAAAAAGWKVTVIDGQGTVSARTAAMNQALTLKPDGIVVGGFDTKEQQVAFDAATKAGATVVGWHSGTKPGPEPEFWHLRQCHDLAAGCLQYGRLRSHCRFRRQGRRHHLHRHAI